MSQRVFGYARVSSRDQNLDRQLDAFIDYGINAARVYCDKASGKDFERPEYKRLVRKLRKGDVLVIKSIDRLGRSYREVLDEWRQLTKDKGISIVVLDMPLLDTREAKEGLTHALIADIVLQLLSYVAQIERDNIHQRQAEGIAAAKARGVRFGRPAIDRPASYSEVIERFYRKSITREQAAEELCISVSTFDRWRKADAKEGLQVKTNPSISES